jgi:hypothetical protein
VAICARMECQMRGSCAYACPTAHLEQRPQPHSDFELARVCRWLYENGYAAHVKLDGSLELRKR